MFKQFSFFFSRPTPPDGNPSANVLGVSKRVTLNKEELLAVNRFLCCRGLAVIGRGDQVETYRKAVVNGFVYNSAKLAKSKLKNSHCTLFSIMMQREIFNLKKYRDF